ncbi:MAG TPA: Cj0069 family protein [Ramlibacter sp.]|uniref:Cj0069 family protein n=1 Tax=Ramlibacter sp. TaxID=1917967 RepID=UPI002B660AC2|nr:Cj0069 family protein [Ramlibacter sp.]HVZ44945.1 Cj0069 family protein [Ramlibacter sp.]
MTQRPVALLYPGDRAARDRSNPAESRFAALFDAFASAGIRAEAAVYHDDFADEVQAQLRNAALVLVWHNPIHEGRRRDRLDAMLRELADSGVTVSAHPDTILKLGTKDVLFDTRDLPFGSDVHRVESLSELKTRLPQRLARGARVLKQHRGHSGIGVWRVESVADSDGLVRVLHAERGSVDEVIALAELMRRLAPYFEPARGGHMIDQPWQPRLVDGTVRAYLVEDRVAGFGLQAVNALFPAAPDGQTREPGPRLYHDADLRECQGLRRLLESGWIEQLRTRVGVPHARLPLLWDCDFMYREHGSADADGFVLCEINVSSVAPFPPSVIGPLVEAVRRRLVHSS